MSRWLRGSDAWIFGGLLVVALVAKAPVLAETLKAQFVSSDPAVAATSVESATQVEAPVQPGTSSDANPVVESPNGPSAARFSPQGPSCPTSCGHFSY